MARNNRDNDSRDTTVNNATVSGGGVLSFTHFVGSGPVSIPAPSRPSSGYAADPVRVASANPSSSPGRVVASPRDYYPPQSLSEQSAGGYSASARANESSPSQSVRAAPSKRASKLTLSAPKAGPVQPAPRVVTKQPQQVKSTSETSSPKAREKMTCKARPTDNRPKGGGGGKRGFIPWCG